MARGGLGGLLLAGAAAFGLYKYSKMTEEQKQQLKDKGKKLVDENLGGLKGMFGGNQQAGNSGSNGSGYNNNTPNSYNPQG